MDGRIEILGEVSCRGPAGVVDRRRLAAKRTRVAVVRLVTARGEAVTRESLADTIWPQGLPPTWRAALRTIIAEVRAALAEAGWDRGALVSGAGGLRLVLDRVVVDLFEAEAALAAAETAVAGGCWDAAMREGVRARDILRRPLLTDVEGGWVDECRRRTEQSLARALSALGAAAVPAGDHVLALEAATEAVELEPLSEPAHRALARAHAAAGDRPAALAAYERCRRLLADELGVAPSPETESLYLELLGGTAAARPLPPALRLPVRFDLVGRAGERAALTTAWERAAVGDGRLLVVSGPAGSGKSRLVADLAVEVHRSGATLRWGRCGEDLPPMVALEEAGAPAPGGDRDEWLIRIASWLRDLASTGPVMVVVDDAQWAGPGLVLALRRLAREVRDRAVCMVLTVRDVAGHRPPPIAALLADVERDGVIDRISLGPLTTDDVGELLEQQAGRSLDDAAVRWATDLVRHTGGNALFVTESVQWLWDIAAIRCDELGAWTMTGPAAAVSPAVGSLVAGRIAALGPDAADLLAAAAVAGDPFDVRILARFAPGGVDEVLAVLEAALATGLVVEDPVDGRLWRFSHAIVRDAIALAVPAARQMELHRQVGEAIEADSSLGSRAQAARHLLIAAPLGDVDRAVAYAVAAADEAMSVHAAEDAVDLVDEALRFQLDHSVRAGLLVRRGHALRDSGRADEARDAFDEATVLARKVGDGELLAKAALGATRGQTDRSEWVGDDAGRQLLGEALDHLGPGVLRIRLLGELALRTQDRERRQLLSTQALDLVEREPTTEARLAGYPASLVAHWSPVDTADRLAYSRVLIDGLRDDPRHRAVVGLDRLADLVRIGERDAFDRERVRLTSEIAVLGDRRPHWAIRTFEHLVATMSGRWDAAAASADDILAVWGGTPDVDAVMSHRGQRAWAFGLAGDASAMVTVARLGTELFPEVPIYRVALAWATAKVGDLVAARTMLEGIAADEWSGLPRDSGHGAAVVVAAEAVAAVGDHEQAAALLGIATPFADHVAVLAGPCLFMGPVALALGQLAALLGRDREARAMFELARERALRLGATPWAEQAQSLSRR